MTKQGVIIFKGKTYPLRQWFKDNGAKYKPIFGWYYPYGTTLPKQFPEGITPYYLPSESYINNNSEFLPNNVIRNNIDALFYEPGTSKFVGTIGERIIFKAYFKQKITVHLNNGADNYNIYLIEDCENNIYTWRTESERFEEGKTYYISATIKDHKTYKNENQTVLSNVRKRREE